jgi:primosomal protein N' (replication factor Y)
VDPESLPRSGTNGADPGGRPLIYLTTWIGTKEAVRPDVALVGVLDADALIRRPEWRAAESAYHALSEMAAWAGPGGRLFVQTQEPGHHAVQAVVRGDYEFWLQRELEARKDLGYPPYCELVRVAAFGDKSAEAIHEAAAACERGGGRVLGPIQARVRSSRDSQARDALEILVKCPDALPVADELRSILASRPNDLRVDVDPRS